MSLGAVLNSARTSLSAISSRTQVVSENISNADNPDYSRRIAENVSATHGILRVSVNRAQDRNVLEQVLEYTSVHTANMTLQDGLDELQLIYGDVDSEISPSAMMNRLQTDLHAFISMPDSASAASQVVGSARDLAAGISRGAETVADLRRSADEEIARSVDRINALLLEFHKANAAIVTGRLTDTERVQNEDTRDRVLVELAEELDIRTVEQNDGGLAIYTTGGAVLYERGPREVRFDPLPTLTSGMPGGQVYIDNVPVTGDGAVMRLSSGRISGLIELRDEVAAGWEKQLDEMARGLIEAFAESDQSGGGNPDVPGLFTWSGSPAMPPSGTHVPGLARDLQVNPAVDPLTGGDPFLLRDGGMGGAAYVYNTTGVAGYTDRLLELNAALDAPRAFDPSAGLSDSVSVKEFAGLSVSWVEQRRANAARNADYSSALLTRASDALSKATGVDLDSELELMMRLERSYQATARLLTTVDNMLGELMNAMR